MEQMQCPACGKIYAPHFKYCPDDGTKLIPVSKMAGIVKPLKPPYDDPYGLWIVTTEGDEEGRTTRQLGSFEGYLDEIAQQLAGQAFYSLNFKKAHELPATDNPTHKAVSIQLDIKSGTWDLTPQDRAATIADLLKDRPVMVTKGQYYASAILKFKEQEQ